LSQNGRPFGQLDVTFSPGKHERCFGPFRSRRLAECARDAAAMQFELPRCPATRDKAVRASPRETAAGRLCDLYFRGTCCGPCADRISRDDFDERLRRHDALLRGLEDASLIALEAEVEAAADLAGADGDPSERARRAQVLRLAFDQGAVQRRAEDLMLGMVILPGARGSRKVVMFTPIGARFDSLPSDHGDAARILARLNGAGGSRAALPNRRLPINVSDSLCLAARELSRGAYRFIPRGEVCAIDAAGLLRLGRD
jgi:hypothetical protein